jgi:cyclopropane fatty-acyl-phospholipid synthase-like methyltransferase
MRSNVDCWKDLHDNGYFPKHKYFKGYRQDGLRDVLRIEGFVKLKPTDVVVVIGCGYGRESAAIARIVKTVYGIDVGATIFAMAKAYLDEQKITNFVPVLAERYAQEIPDGIDLIYSIVTMQHVTRDIVRDYLTVLGRKLSPTGSMVLQFLETSHGEQDANIAAYEPCVSWTMDEIKEAAQGLRMIASADVIGKTWVHHWVHLGV